MKLILFFIGLAFSCSKNDSQAPDDFISQEAVDTSENEQNIQEPLDVLQSVSNGGDMRSIFDEDDDTNLFEGSAHVVNFQ